MSPLGCVHEAHLVALRISAIGGIEVRRILRAKTRCAFVRSTCCKRGSPRTFDRLSRRREEADLSSVSRRCRVSIKWLSHDKLWPASTRLAPEDSGLPRLRYLHAAHPAQHPKNLVVESHEQSDILCADLNMSIGTHRVRPAHVLLALVQERQPIGSTALLTSMAPRP